MAGKFSSGVHYGTKGTLVLLLDLAVVAIVALLEWLLAFGRTRGGR